MDPEQVGTCNRGRKVRDKFGPLGLVAKKTGSMHIGE